MAKKISRSLVLALALVFALTSIAFAATYGFGILNFHPEQAENRAYLDHIVSINETWEGESFTAALHEAVFDGRKLSMTMSFFPGEDSDPVFVIPRIHGVSGEREIQVSTQMSTGSFDECGFWIPSIAPGHEDACDQIGLDATVEGDGETGQVIRDIAAWEVTFDVLRPIWPIAFTKEDEPGTDEEPWTEKEYEEYDEQFRKAYLEKMILLNREAMLSPFAAASPFYDVSMEEKMDYADWSEELLTREAFTLSDRLVFRFSTDPLPVKTSGENVEFDLPDGLHLEVTELNVAADEVSFAIRMTGKEPGKVLTMDDWRHRAFAVLADGAVTEYLASSCGQREDGSLLYTGSCMITGEPSSLTLVPVEAGEEQAIMKSGDVPERLLGSVVTIEIEGAAPVPDP
ncbi:MAG: hypothetical protein IJ083_13325 [Clostridia bacterium]|nr:hypothetical protein [Clostridia bacterium]